MLALPPHSRRVFSAWSLRALLAGGAMAGLGTFHGCATWDVPDTQREFRLPAPVVRADAIVYEMAFVRWPAPSSAVPDASTGDSADSIWQLLDEQFLPADARGRLTANGLRAGVLSDPLPDAIRGELERGRDPLAVIANEDATAGAELLARRERRQCQSGERQEIEILPPQPGDRVVLIHEEGRVRAERFTEPRAFFRLQPTALGDGTVRFQLLPLVEFGQPKQRVIGGNGIYRYDTSRDLRTYEFLAIRAQLKPGRTLVVTCTPEAKGLGESLFAHRFDGSTDQLLLLLRLAESQGNELFSPPTTQAPIVTPLEL